MDGNDGEEGAYVGRAVRRSTAEEERRGEEEEERERTVHQLVTFSIFYE